MDVDELAPYEEKLKDQAVQYLQQEKRGWGLGVKGPESAREDWHEETGRLQRLILLEIERQVEEKETAEGRRMLLEELHARYTKMDTYNQWPEKNLTPFRRVKEAVEQHLELVGPDESPSGTYQPEVEAASIFARKSRSEDESSRGTSVAPAVREWAVTSYKHFRKSQGLPPETARDRIEAIARSHDYVLTQSWLSKVTPVFVE